MHHFFDLDATLLDHAGSQRGGLAALSSFSPSLRPAVDDDLLRLWQAAETRHFSRFEQGEISMSEQRRARLRECFPDPCSTLNDEELDSLYAVYLKGYRSAWSLYPDTLPVLEQLSGPRALITNGDAKLQRAKIQCLGLQDLFQGIYISGELGFAKPDARIFSRACKELDVHPSEVAYVGDNFRNDVEGSAAAGMSPIWMNRSGMPRPAAVVSFREISTLYELLPGSSGRAVP